MKTRIAGAAAGLALLGLAGAGIAAAAGGGGHVSGGGGTSPSRLDDGRQYASQAKVSEQQAIAAAQTRAAGRLNEVDLEHRGASLVYNVDVGSHDVKVDAASGEVVAVDADD